MAVDPDTNQPLVVCTPSLENAASRNSRSSAALHFALLLLLSLLLLV